MLKSTHQGQRPLPGPPPLPPGWTEHKAPTGHTYYYNAETKQSTYTRPTAQPQPYIPPAPGGESYAANNFHPNFAQPYNPTAYVPPHQFFQPGQQHGRGGFRGGHGYQDRRRQQPADRPKHRYAIPGCAPWVLVKTKLGRRFVHNTETNESFWKFPEDVMKGVVEFDRLERERRERRERGEASDGEEGEGAAAGESMATGANAVVPVQDAQGEDEQEGSGSEYEEVEVTDDEKDEDADEDNPSKRQKTSEPPQDQPHEFNEDDIAYQLAAMGADYGLDPGEYGVDDENGSYEPGAEGLPLTDEDAQALFRDLLDDHHINPYTPWDAVLEDGRIIDDDRYTALPTTKARRETFDAWSRERIAALKAQREKQAKLNPRIPYLAFLAQHASPKLYWPEFKRKYRKEAEMRDSKLADKDREKLYREHVARVSKLSRETREADLRKLLAEMPLRELNRGTQMDALPEALLSDLRFISLPASLRDEIVKSHISSLPPAPEVSGLSAEEEEEARVRRRERERRERALRERERRVEEEKRRQRREREYGRGRLREEEMELRRAMRVGKEGLRGQIEALGREEGEKGGQEMEMTA